MSEEKSVVDDGDEVYDDGEGRLIDAPEEKPKEKPGEKSVLAGSVTPDSQNKDNISKLFPSVLSGRLDIKEGQIKVTGVRVGSIIIDYEISGEENELKQLKSKISVLPQNSIVVDGVVSEETTEPQIIEVKESEGDSSEATSVKIEDEPIDVSVKENQIGPSSIVLELICLRKKK